MVSIYIVEDDQAIRAALARTLAGRGHQVRAARQALEALPEILETVPDVVVLDLGLPDVDGATLLKMIRGVSDVPVVIATARDEEATIVALLNAGADDYLVKPFSADQLEARVHAVLRRNRSGVERNSLRVGSLDLDRSSRVATLAGKLLDLTPKEFDLLAMLASRAGEVVTKNEILAEVWRQPFGGGDKTVDVHLSWLRKKLGETAQEPRFLRSVRGVGVKLVDPEEA